MMSGAPYALSFSSSWTARSGLASNSNASTCSGPGRDAHAFVNQLHYDNTVADNVNNLNLMQCHAPMCSTAGEEEVEDHVNLQQRLPLISTSIVDVHTPNAQAMPYAYAYAYAYASDVSPIAIATKTDTDCEAQPAFVQVHRYLTAPSLSSPVTVASIGSPEFDTAPKLPVADHDLIMNSKQTPTSICGSALSGIRTGQGPGALRAKTACLRCRSRKQKCNGEQPVCSQCKNACKGRGAKQPCEYTQRMRRRSVDSIGISGCLRLPSSLSLVNLHVGANQTDTNVNDLHVNTPIASSSPRVHTMHSAVTVSPAVGSYFPPNGMGMCVTAAAVANETITCACLCSESDVSNASSIASSASGTHYHGGSN